MAEESWHEARLIPTSGINGADEQERRATSALLAVVSAVQRVRTGTGQAARCAVPAPSRPTSRSRSSSAKASCTRTASSASAAVPAPGPRWWRSRPAPTHSRPSSSRTTSTSPKEQGYDAVLTISNEIPAVAGQHPTKVDKRKLRKVALHHLSWTQVLAEAVMEKEFRGVADPDQAWILGELIRYLEHSRSGALEFEDMGETWVAVRDAVAAGTLRATDKGIADVVARFDALLRFASLRLGRQLGTEVVPVLSRKEQADPTLRAQALTTMLCQTGQLSGAIRIPDTVGQLVVTADLRASKVTCHVDVDAPREGRPTTRVNWLVRQLKAAPDSVRVETFNSHGRGSSAAELLGAVRENPAVLVVDPDQGDPVVPPGAHRRHGHQAWSRPRVVHRLRARCHRHVLRRRPPVPQGMVGGTAEASAARATAAGGGADEAIEPELD